MGLWNASLGAAAYNLKRSTTNGGPYGPLLSSTGTSCTDTGLANGTTYYYVVSAVNTNGESANSSPVSVTPLAQPILLTVVPEPSGQFAFQFQGVDGRNYVVQTSSNLMDWASILTNQQTGGLFLYSDTNATAPALFYRVKQ